MTASLIGTHQFSRYLRIRDNGHWTAVFHELAAGALGIGRTKAY